MNSSIIPTSFDARVSSCLISFNENPNIWSGPYSVPHGLRFELSNCKKRMNTFDNRESNSI